MRGDHRAGQLARHGKVREVPVPAIEHLGTSCAIDADQGRPTWPGGRLVHCLPVDVAKVAVEVVLHEHVGRVAGSPDCCLGRLRQPRTRPRVVRRRRPRRRGRSRGYRDGPITDTRRRACHEHADHRCDRRSGQQRTRQLLAHEAPLDGPVHITRRATNEPALHRNAHAAWCWSVWAVPACQSDMPGVLGERRGRRAVVGVGAGP